MSRSHLIVLKWVFLAGIFALITLSIACSKSERNAEPQAEAAQKTFASPEEAGKALMGAAKADDRNALLSMFGPTSKELIFSNDSAADKKDLQGFVSDYEAMHRWRKLDDGGELLITGTDNKTFPIPLKKNAAGQWYFDTSAGKQEMLARRIGNNENAVIDVCIAIANAQQSYFSKDHGGVKQYAQKFISDQGQQDGLYWPPTQGQPRSPLGPLVADATAQGLNLQPNEHRPFYGYYFAMLDKQGADAKGGAKNYIVDGKMTRGFAVLAYPAHYRESGVMTFMINQQGVVYQKDLGPETDQAAAAITAFDPDKSWKPVEQ